MPDAWFPPDGAYFFALAGLLSLTALAAPWIARGDKAQIVRSVWSAIIALGGVFFALGLTAYVQAQPPHVYAPLLATGAAMALGYALSLVFVLRAYRLAERRKIAAHEL